jgi:hypothetical protein
MYRYLRSDRPLKEGSATKNSLIVFMAVSRFPNLLT